MSSKPIVNKNLMISSNVLSPGDIVAFSHTDAITFHSATAQGGPSAVGAVEKEGAIEMHFPLDC